MDRYPVEKRLYRTEPEVQVLVESQAPEGARAGDVVLVHGLEGSGQAGYMRSLAAAALAAGYGAHRFNLRTCGGTEHLCPTLYHAGLTSDLRSVLEQLRTAGRAPVWLVGFSLGANVVLKLAGEMGEGAGELIRGVCGVSAPIDLAACVRRMAARENRVYEGRFVRRMRERLIKTGRYSEADFAGVKTVREIDERITAPSFGFGGAGNYYATQSASQFVPAIRIPTLLLQAKDDTLIPPEVFARPEVTGNGHVRLVMTEHGGHVGFIAKGKPRFWLNGAILEWITSQQGTNGQASSSRV